jgi:hypothetical protein
VNLDVSPSSKLEAEQQEVHCFPYCLAVYELKNKSNVDSSCLEEHFGYDSWIKCPLKLFTRD